jgi:hypothetical protein
MVNSNALISDQMDNGKPLKDRERNIEAFRLIISGCAGIEMFPFFGTLLGIARENSLIAMDDDVDFYVQISERGRLEERLSKLPVTVDMSLERNHSPYFLQASAVVDGEEVLVDFYFYETGAESTFISDRWNFSALWNDPRNEMRVPKEIIFPLQRKSLFDVEFFLPLSPARCCRFLYGSSWEKPLAKGSQYFISIDNYVPKLWLEESQFVALREQLDGVNSELRSSNEKLEAISSELDVAKKKLEAREKALRKLVTPILWLQKILRR